jgi:Family of unknown function (DUF6527)
MFDIFVEYATVVHLCACGCGAKVVCPLDPTDYAITSDGQTVSLWPSVGNWDYHCRSHYIIRRSKVRWAPPMSEADIAAGRERDRRVKAAQGAGWDPLWWSMPEPQPPDLAEPVDEQSTTPVRTSASGVASAIKALLRKFTRRGEHSK